MPRLTRTIDHDRFTLVKHGVAVPRRPRELPERTRPRRGRVGAVSREDIEEPRPSDGYPDQNCGVGPEDDPRREPVSGASPRPTARTCPRLESTARRA